MSVLLLYVRLCFDCHGEFLPVCHQNQKEGGEDACVQFVCVDTDWLDLLASAEDTQIYVY